MVIISTIALGSWYPQGVIRMLAAFGKFPNHVRIVPWSYLLPPGTPTCIEDGEDYTAYCARPFAIQAGFDAGASIVLYLDASYYPIAAIQPLITHIEDVGYYLQANNFLAGQWLSDRSLSPLGITREEAMTIPDVAGGAVGFTNTPRCRAVLDNWKRLALDGITIPGHRTNSFNFEAGRDLGFVSSDPRVLGHRPGQGPLSVLVHRHGLIHRVPRPRFCAYLGKETAETVLVAHGGPL
jgi:hypothetical protein